MSTESVKRTWGLLALLLASIGLLCMVSHAMNLLGAAPAWLETPLTYLASTFGAAMLGLAWLAAGVAKAPARAHVAALPVFVALQGMALVRLATFAFDETMPGLGLAPALAGEVVFFSLLGGFVSTARPGAPSVLDLFRELMTDMRHLSPALMAWLVVLVLGAIVAPALAIGETWAQTVMLCQVMNVGLGIALLDVGGGLTRVAGVAHLVGWPVGWLAALSRLQEPDVSALAWLCAITMGISLLFDGVDLVRYLRGDRDRPSDTAGA